MPLYHLLGQPLNVDPNTGKRIWVCLCGQKVSLPNVQPANQAISIPNNRVEVMECPSCYAGTDEKDEQAPPITEQGDIKPTFDQDLGKEDDDQAIPGQEDDDGQGDEDGRLIKEEKVDFPDAQ
jgi:hypothetical protein